MIKNLAIYLPLTMLLVACSKSEPITLKESDKVYLGVWKYINEHKTDTSLHIDNMLLAVHKDSSAQFMKCYISASWSKGGKIVRKNSNRASVVLPSAFITELSTSNMTLSQSIELFTVDYKLTITKQPYIKSERWFIGIDDKILSKVEENIPLDLSDWNCPENKNDTQS